MRNWTPEERAKQAALCRHHRPWQNSTGPKTEAGKARAALNAVKDNWRGREAKKMRGLLRGEKEFCKRLDDELGKSGLVPPHELMKLRAEIFTNELLRAFEERENVTNELLSGRRKSLRRKRNAQKNPENFDDKN